VGHPRPCVARAVMTDIGVLRLHVVIGFANDKVPLRKTGLKSVPISQRADGGVKGKTLSSPLEGTLKSPTRQATRDFSRATKELVTFRFVERLRFEEGLRCRRDNREL
jgi:hypothetical protein